MIDFKNNKDFYFLKFIFFIRYLADAMFYSFTALYLSSIGLKEGIIGTIQSITTITCLIVNPIWSILAKNNKVSRILLLVLSIIEGVIITIYGNLSIIELIMLLTSLAAIVAGPYYNILDGYAASFCEKEKKDYPSLRVMGSLGYVIGVLVSGIIIDLSGYNITFMIAGILFILCGILTIYLKKINKDDEMEKERNFRKILINKNYILYMLFYLLTVTITTIADSFLPLLFTNIKGLTTSQFSIINSCVLLCEVIVILLMNRFVKKYNSTNLLLFSGFIYFLKLLLSSFIDLPLYVLIPVLLLRGVAWGVVLFIHIKHVKKLVGLENITSATIILTTLAALFQFIMNNVVGYLIENNGYDFTYKLIAVLILSITIIYLIFEKFIFKNDFTIEE